MSTEATTSRDNTIPNPEPKTPAGSTRHACDFYLGRNEDAILLGTRHSAGAPWHMPLWTHLQQHSLTSDFTVTDYVVQVRRWADTATDDSPDLPALWPHSYPDSSGTQWTICYDLGSVYLYHWGVEMAVLRCNFGKWVPCHIVDPGGGDDTQEVYAPRKAWARFPDMIGGRA